MARRHRAAFALVAVALGGCGRAAPDLPLLRAAGPPPTLAGPESPPTTAVVAAQAVSRPNPPLWPVVDRNVQVPGPPYNVAQVMVPTIGLYESPTAPAPLATLSSRTEHGFPRLLLAVGQQGDRWEVLLPMRPNGAVGWVRAADVDIQQVTYWIRVNTAAHTLTVGDGAQIVDTESVATGTGGTPTPLGTFYLTELIRPIGQPYYGPYAYTLTAHSDVLHSFMGGDGTIGIHGTDAPGSIGRAVSHGCIRMSNTGITQLAHTLPLGTPVFVS